MAITDLSNTTWYVPSGWTCIAGYGYFMGIANYVDFNNSGIEEYFTELFIGYSNQYVSTAENTIYFLNTGNDNEAVKTNDTSFTIRFGSGLTEEPLLLSWLETNGKLISGGTPDEPTTDTKPIYLRKNDAWVKQNAYERVNDEWVQISYSE